MTSPSRNGGTYDLTSFIAAAHVRVDRHERVPDQHLAVGRLGHVDLDEREVGRLGHPAAAARPDESLGSSSSRQIL